VGEPSRAKRKVTKLYPMSDYDDEPVEGDDDAPEDEVEEENDEEEEEGDEDGLEGMCKLLVLGIGLDFFFHLFTFHFSLYCSTQRRWRRR
jgi:hypothetical protein